MVSELPRSGFMKLFIKTTWQAKRVSVRKIQTEVAISPDHGSDAGAKRGFVGGIGKGDPGGAIQKFRDLLDCLES
jgi:hypothetical protein